MRNSGSRPFGFIALTTAVTFLSVGAVRADDDVRGTRYALLERAHEISARVDRGFATLIVERVVENVGPRVDQAQFQLFVPTTAVATRLRSKGDGNKWFEGELMDADEAAKKYTELTGYGGAYPKDPALLSWRSQGHLVLQVFPVAAKSTKTVEYTLMVPLTYAEGVYTMKLPSLGSSTTPASIRFASARSEDELRVNDVPVSGNVRVGAKGEIQVKLIPRGNMRLEGKFVSVALENDRSFFRAELDVPPRLGEVPQGAAIAVVIDSSKSLSEEASANALMAAQGYLSHFDRATVTVITFDRHVDMPFGTNISVKEARARLAGHKLSLKNGSHLDDALKRADAVVAANPSPSKRIVVITDALTRSALTAETFAARGLTSGAIVHMGITDGRATEVQRNDDSPWAALPRRTGGLLWDMAETSEFALAREQYEQWARPMRIDRTKMTGMPDDFWTPDSIDEGTALEHITIRGDATTAVTLTGEIWSRPVSASFSTSREEEKRWSALVFGTSVMYGLTEPEQRILATKGGAVSPVTSYLAFEPGVRPSTEGLKGSGDGFGGGGGRSLGSSHSARLASLRTKSDVESPQAILTRELAKAWERCVGKGTVKARIETTLAEVVDLTIVTDPANTTTQTCVAERLWEIDAPRESFDEAFATFDVVAKR